MRVGTSGGLVLAGAYNMDHPHACGDKNHTSLSIARHSGSSPCVWGQVDVTEELNFIHGIIPMRVGTRI